MAVPTVLIAYKQPQDDARSSFQTTSVYIVWKNEDKIHAANTVNQEF